VSVLSSPSGATVEVNGRAAGRTPLEGLQVPKEACTISLAKSGYRGAKRKLPAGGDGDRLDPIDVVLTPLLGSMNVVCLDRSGGRVKADIYLDGRKVEQTPARLSRLRPRRYTLQLRGKGFSTQRRAIMLRPGESRRVVFRIER
jgi:hypothetical protein